MSTPTVFISHVHEEAKLAQTLSKKLATIFTDGKPQIKFFESSQINPGALWEEPLQRVLSECKLAIVLVSGRSIDQPWINFEVGRAWGCEVLPLCHSGFQPNRLGSPLGMKNSLDMSRPGWMARLVDHLAGVTNWSSGSFALNADSIQQAENEIGAVVATLPVYWSRPDGSKPAYVFRRGDAVECLTAIESEFARCKSVAFCGIGLHIFRRDTVQRLLNDRVKGGHLTGRICMANWESPAVQQRVHSEYGGRMAPSPASILQNMVELEREIKNPARFAVKQFDVPPPYALMIFDTSVYTYPYGVGLPGDQCPTFYVQGNESVFDFYTSQFEEIWRNRSHVPIL